MIYTKLGGLQAGVTMDLFLAVEVTGLSFFIHFSSSAFSTVAKFHEKMLKGHVTESKGLLCCMKVISPAPTP